MTTISPIRFGFLCVGVFLHVQVFILIGFYASSAAVIGNAIRTEMALLSAVSLVLVSFLQRTDVAPFIDVRLRTD